MRIADRAGFFGLWLFSFSAFLSTAAAVAGYVIFTFALLFSNARWRQWVLDPLVLSCLGFGLFAGLQTYLAVQAIPEAADEMWDKLMGWEKLLIFIPFGYWVARRPDWRLGLLLASVVGLILGMLLKVDWAQLGQFMHTRSGFQFPAIGFAYVAGLAMLGLALFGGGQFKQSSPWKRGAWLFLIGVMLLILAQGFIQSYSRGGWLAMFVTLCVMAVIWYWRRDHLRGQVSTRVVVSVAVLLTAVTLAVVLLNQDKIKQRIAYEADVFSQIVSAERNETIPSSTGLRLNVWAYGLKKFIERPLFGWGPGTAGYLVAHSGQPEKLSHASGEWLPHLHNTYIEVLVQFGLAGLIWILLILILFGRIMIRASRAGEMPQRYALFFIAVLVFASVWAFFDYRIVHRDWRFSWILLAGTLFSFHLQMIWKNTGTNPGKAGRE